MSSIHGLAIIKNDENKYLQYYDTRWESYLFFNCKLENSKDTTKILEQVSNTFSNLISNIEITYIDEKVHTKYSESAKKEKEYLHSFFKVNYQNKLPEDTFQIDGITYKWFSYEELLNDKRIQKVNGDIVRFLKEFNL